MSVLPLCVPDNIKIAKVIPVYKKDQNYLLVVTDRFQYDPVSRNFLKVLFLTVSRILLMNITYFLVSNSVPGNAIQPVWQWLTCSKIILGLLLIKNSLLEVSSTNPKHLTLCPRNSFSKAVPLWHTQSCLRLGQQLFQR